MNETVTILIPTYRRPAKLKRAISSVLDQTYQSVRVWVFDNASNDDTESVVQEIISTDKRVAYHCHAQNIGLTANFNYAFAQVDTPYFGLLADDDYFSKTFLMEAMHAFEEHPTIQFSILSTPTIDESGAFLFDQLSAWPKEGLYAAGESIATAIKGNHPIITAAIYRGALAMELQFDQEADSISDLPVMISLLAKYPFHISKKIGGYFVRHDNTSGQTFAKLDNFSRLCPAYLRAEELIASNLPRLLRSRNRILRIFKHRIDKLFFFLMLESLSMQREEISGYMRNLILKRSPSAWQLGGAALCLLHSRMGPSQTAGVITGMRGILRRIRRSAGHRTGSA